MSGGPRARLFVLLVCMCFCCRGGDPDKPVLGAHSFIILHYIQSPPPPRIPRIHRRRSSSSCPGRRLRQRLRYCDDCTSTAANLHLIFILLFYFFSLLRKRLRIASRDRLSSTHYNMRAYMFTARAGRRRRVPVRIYFIFIFNFNYCLYKNILYACIHYIHIPLIRTPIVHLQRVCRLRSELSIYRCTHKILASES